MQGINAGDEALSCELASLDIVGCVYAPYSAYFIYAQAVNIPEHS